MATSLMTELENARKRLDYAKGELEAAKLECSYWEKKVEELKEKLRLINDEIERAAH